MRPRRCSQKSSGPRRHRVHPTEAGRETSKSPSWLSQSKGERRLRQPQARLPRGIYRISCDNAHHSASRSQFVRYSDPINTLKSAPVPLWRLPCVHMCLRFVLHSCTDAANQAYALHSSTLLHDGRVVELYCHFTAFAGSIGRGLAGRLGIEPPSYSE
ncbi:hypothetical protein PENSPDRAFT_47714 [Peniophora sp. CONT]|nr:hypothetical protein PENSPDRAFT_47714 [Peniophora sp. CONT]